MPKKLKHKTFTITSSLLITAITTAVAVYAGVHISANAPGSALAEAVPVGVSTVQQMVLVAWSEYSEHLKETCKA
jgi:hypothetical protein